MTNKLVKKIIKKILLFLLIILWIFLLVIFLQKPSLNRNWTLDQKILSEISFAGDSVEIKNVRNFKYNTEDDYEVSYYNRVYNLSEINSLYYIIEPFSDYDWPAHTMLSFWFENWDFLVVSAEIRKEIWESFSPFWWLLNKYEIVYVLWDENDLIKLRANYRKDDVFMYPIKLEKEKLKELFIITLERADKLSKEPEFYNTLTNTCTTSILMHLNSVRENSWKDKISWSKLVFLPSHSDLIAYDLGLINTNLSLEEAREYYKINDLSEIYAEEENYSLLIRKEIK